jgi:signal transduction histidine kinase
MSRYRRIGLAIIEGVLFLVVLVIGWAALRAFHWVREMDRVPVTFREMSDTYSRIGIHLESAVNDLNETFGRFAARRDRGDWDQFLRQSRDLKSWIDQQKESSLKAKVLNLQPVQIKVDIGELLGRIDTAYQAYLLEARKAVREAPPANAPAAPPVNTENVRQQSRALLRLAVEARAQGQAIDIFLSGSETWYLGLQKILNGVLLILGALGLWLAIVVYRRVVSPLRQRIAKSDTIIERQQKLAHFGELAAGVAHEIRNPLTAIRARLFTLQKSLAAGTPAHEDALVIRNEIDRLNRIVSDFLQLARPAEPHRVPLSAESLLNEVKDLFLRQCEKQGIELKVESENGARFLADPRQMKQVLINLVQNAADSIEVDGTITLRAHRDTGRLANGSAEDVTIEIQDTGPGIPPAIQKRLFDPFFSTKEGGTGLGLSIAAQIVNNHGGKLEFQTQPSQGTTFAIVLPALPEPA